MLCHEVTHSGVAKESFHIGRITDTERGYAVSGAPQDFERFRHLRMGRESSEGRQKFIRVRGGQSVWRE